MKSKVKCLKILFYTVENNKILWYLIYLIPSCANLADFKMLYFFISLSVSSIYLFYIVICKCTLVVSSACVMQVCLRQACKASSSDEPRLRLANGMQYRHCTSHILIGFAPLHDKFRIV